MVCYLGCTEVKKMFGYDDSLDAFGVHGIGGNTGAILTGVFATSAVNTVFKDASGRCAAERFNRRQFETGSRSVDRFIGRNGLTVVGTFIILKVVDLIVGVPRERGRMEVTVLT